MNEKIIISYCLYGTSNQYFLPLLKSIEYINKYHADEIRVVIHISNKYCNNRITLLNNYDCDVYYFDDSISNAEKMLSRVNTVFYDVGSSIFFRDSDSVFDNKDYLLIKDFIESKASFQIIRDHPLHYMPIMGGLWGLKRIGYNIIKQNWSAIKSHSRFSSDLYNSDQIILADLLYDKIIKSSIIYTDFNLFLNELDKYKKISYIGVPLNTFLGRTDSNYIDNDNYLFNLYKKGRMKIYLPFILFKLFRYRVLFKLFIKFNNFSFNIK